MRRISNFIQFLFVFPLIVFFLSCKDNASNKQMKGETKTFVASLPVPEGYARFTKDGTGAFSLSYPQTWSIGKNSNPSVSVILIEPERDANFLTNLNVVVVSASQSIDEVYSQMTEDQMKEGMPADYRLIAKSKEKVNGKDCVKLVAAYSIPGNTIRQIQYIVVKEAASLYFITFSMDANRYEVEQSTMQKIMNSLEF